jgi:Cu-Zn family superoxide dismutase
MTTPITLADGTSIGTLSLTAAPSGVLLQVDITKGLTPGWHGMHFHQTGDCSDPKFMTSGGHMNHAESKKPHGLLNPEGPDFGDMVNLYAAADGSAHGQAFTTAVRLEARSSATEAVLRDADGSALVIHANADDHISQPIGGAGARVACAVIK